MTSTAGRCCGMLEARGLSLALPDRGAKPLFGAPPLRTILDDIDLSVGPGESLGIVGESGSGKTTLGRCLLRLYEPMSGRLLFDGRDITHLKESALRPLRARMQMIFQDPQSSLNPRRRVINIVAQPLLSFGLAADRRAAVVAAERMLERVGLGGAFGRRYAHELSGGQRQRVGIARAIVGKPALVVADEIVSGLDVSTQAQILDLLAELKRDMGISLVFISHDLSVVRVVCDRVMVMHEGVVVESGSCARLFAAPSHPYTRNLLAAIPLPEIEPGWIDGELGGENGAAEAKGQAMDIQGSVAFVTGCNRGIGRELVTALVAAGAAKVYASARNVEALTDLAAAHGGRVEVLALDINDHDAVADVAKKCGDVTLLINNAGVNANRPLLGGDMAEQRQEMETNYFGTLAMCSAFAPVLGRNGGGAIANLLTILSRVNLPALGSYSASKAATFSLTQGVRAQLAGQGTLVVGVMPGAVDTEMSAHQPDPKLPPKEVAEAALAAIQAGSETVYVGEMAQGVAAGLAADASEVEKQFAEYLPQ